MKSFNYFFYRTTLIYIYIFDNNIKLKIKAKSSSRILNLFFKLLIEVYNFITKK